MLATSARPSRYSSTLAWIPLAVTAATASHPEATES